MSKLVVVGGSRGLGSAFIAELHSKFDVVFNIDVQKPIDVYDNVSFFEFDLSKDNPCDLKPILEQTDALLICAGIGTVKPFEDYSDIEIKKTFQINTVAEIEILRLFYPALLSGKDKYCLILGSIAGDVSSPLFATYGASKAAVNKICESLNIELEKNGSKNRITCVKPLSIKGTSFTGNNTDLDILKKPILAFVNAMFSRKTELYYDEQTCFDIVNKYLKNKTNFGLESFDYKKSNKRIDLTKKIVIGYLSGTFDLFHIGHLNLIKRAKKMCDYLIVGVHPSGSWKGKETFIPLDERTEILRSIKYVNEVVEAPDEDSDAWNIYHYDMLFVGSDYKGTERFTRYESFLRGKAQIVYFEYTKGTSSTQIRDLIKKY